MSCAGRPHAASTRPCSSVACSARWVSSSACHCTPRQKLAAGSHSASTVPSGARAQTSRPAPMRSAAWWWKELTARPSDPVSQCRSDPRATSTSWAGAKPSWRWRCASSLRSGRCWCSVPPRETLSACSPRQMPSSGRSRSAAAASSASSYSSEARSTCGPSAGWRLLAVDGRVEVGAAAHEQPVEAVEQRARVVDVAVGRQHDGDRARLLQRLRVGQPHREPLRRRGRARCGRAPSPSPACRRPAARA